MGSLQAGGGGVFVDFLSDKTIPQGTWRADLGDWVHDDGLIAGFCSTHSQSLLIPDRGFIYSAGYAKQRQLAAQGPDWSKRKPGIVWRGTASGSGLYTTSSMDWQDNFCKGTTLPINNYFNVSILRYQLTVP